MKPLEIAYKTFRKSINFISSAARSRREPPALGGKTTPTPFPFCFLPPELCSFLWASARLPWIPAAARYHPIHSLHSSKVPRAGKFIFSRVSHPSLIAGQLPGNDSPHQHNMTQTCSQGYREGWSSPGLASSIPYYSRRIKNIEPDSLGYCEDRWRIGCGMEKRVLHYRLPPVDSNVNFKTYYWN